MVRNMASMSSFNNETALQALGREAVLHPLVETGSTPQGLSDVDLKHYRRAREVAAARAARVPQAQQDMKIVQKQLQARELHDKMQSMQARHRQSMPALRSHGQPAVDQVSEKQPQGLYPPNKRVSLHTPAIAPRVRQIPFKNEQPTTDDSNTDLVTLNTPHQVPDMQLRGSDSYTKDLMSRIAAGKATDTERQAFTERVRVMRMNQQCNTAPASSPPSTADLPKSRKHNPFEALAKEYGSQADFSKPTWNCRELQDEMKGTQHLRPADQEQSPTSASSAPDSSQPSPPHAGMHNAPNADRSLFGCQMQLELLDQHKKKVLARAEQDDSLGGSAWDDINVKDRSAPRSTWNASQPPPPSPPADNRIPSTVSDHARQDYQLQLALLKQQNKKRLLMAQSDGLGKSTWETTNGKEYSAPSSSIPIPALPYPDMQMSGIASIASPPAQTFHSGPPAASTRGVQDYQMACALHENQMKQLETMNALPGVVPSRVRHHQPTGNKHPGAKLQDLSLEEEDIKHQRETKIRVLSEQKNVLKQATLDNASAYTKPFCKFLTENPTVFHCVMAMKKQLLDAGWTALDEREAWRIKTSGKYFVERNGSSLLAFIVGAEYEPGNGAAILAGHVDALTAKLKPVSNVPNKAGYLQLGVALYAGGLGPTWWDRDLGIGGRVLVKEGNKIVTKLVKLDWPIARIPTLAPHFGAPANGPFNPETQMVPIIGLDSSSAKACEPFSRPSLLGSSNSPVNSFVSTQPPALVKVIGKQLGLSASAYHDIVNWELELFDVQPAAVGGLDKEFIFAGRIDDKLCSWAALQALIETEPDHTADSGIIKVVSLFDDEKIGILLRQGVRGNFLPAIIERAVRSLDVDKATPDLIGRTYANSFLVSSDVTHAVNPNFLPVYLEHHAPHLNVGVVVSADSNGHMMTDSVSTAVLQRCADKVGAKLQVSQIRNDSRSGGTVGSMLSAATGIRAIDAGIPQLSMHSIRATTGALDPGLGVITFAGFLNGFEEVDKEFRG